jgi:LmbE family N-acetylglucosaminyl deacetylase
MTNVLVVAAHPDDEVLGCGGTVATHASRGDVVRSLILAEGATSRDGDNASSQIKLLRSAACKAASMLGAQEPQFAGLPDNRMDSIDLLSVVKIVEDVIRGFEPSIIYTHHGADLNVDHRITHAAVVTACRPLPGATVRSVYSFETASSTEWSSQEQSVAFRPNHFVDISAHLSAKNDALQCYDMEMRSFPHARSVDAVEALARTRGASVGLAAAEAFSVLRQIR